MQAKSSDQAPTWQTYQAEGDHLWQLSRRADLKQDIHKLWQAAEQNYSWALGTRPRPNVLETIVLHRKIATVLRKQGRISAARNRSLDKGWDLIQLAKGQHDHPITLLVEEALYQLEYAYCDFNEQKWDKLQHQTESMLKLFEYDRTIELHPDFLYVLGCTYNLLAIALEQANVSESETKKNSLTCWEIARDYLVQANNEKSNEVLQDINMNQATRLNERGDCDRSIQISEKILADAELVARLQISRRIGVQQTLAAGYLYRLASGDIEKAHALTSENLTWARRQEDVWEWVNALQLYLKVLHASIDAALVHMGDSFVKQAEDEYDAFRQSGKLDSTWETAPDELELRRLLTEIYLAAGRLPEATVEVEFIEAHRQKDEDRDEGDIYLTLAKFYQKKDELSEARVNFKEARLRFKRSEHWGMVVETDLHWAEVEISQSKWIEAQKRLEETRTIAKGLACKTRIERVTARLQVLQQLRVMVGTMLQPSAQPIMTILFLASDPSNQPRLRFGEELREIEEQLQLAKLRERFNLQSKISVRARDISLALLNLQPRIVHFSGHGAESGGLYLENKVGEAQIAPPTALTALFKQFAQQITCVILNACYTESQAQAIAQHIPYVIGMSHAIEDRASIAFSIGFYQALGAGCTIEEAFSLGGVQIALQGISGDLLPVLIRRGS